MISLLLNYSIVFGASKRLTSSSKGEDKTKVEREYAHECQKVQSSSYTLGSTLSPSWLNQEEAICRSQRQYPEYLEAAKLIPGNTSADEEMRRLYVMSYIWENTSTQHTGVLSFKAENYIKNEPKDVAGIPFGSKITDDFIASNILGRDKKNPDRNKVKEKDYAGSKTEATYVMFRASDYEKGYNLSIRESDGSQNIEKVVLSTDPKLNEELTTWKGGPDAGFFSRITSNKVTPKEELLSKNIDVLGVPLSDPYYTFNDKDQFVNIWGYLSFRKNLSAELSFQDTSTLFNALINRLGEPALKAKNGNYKFAIWIGKNGMRVDLLCREIDARCVAGSVIQVQQSIASGSEKSAVDFFK